MAVVTSASAQSSVTLFGVVDMSVSRFNVTSAWYNSTGNPSLLPANGQTSVRTSQTALAPSGNYISRLGFRGTEDLGGGMAASFWLEGQINPDDGSRALSNFNRRSTVSLTGSFGEVRLGRDYTASFWNDTVFDVFSGAGSGTNLITSISTNLATQRGASTAANPGSIGLGGSDTYVRASNMIGYFLPAGLGGIYGQVQYSLPENVKSDGVATGAGNKGRYFGARLGYASGPLDVAVAHGQNTVADVTAVNAAGVPTGGRTDNKLKTINIGASWDFGIVKVFGELSRVDDVLKTRQMLNAGVFPLSWTEKDTYKGTMLGVQVPIGAGLVRAAYETVKYKNGLSPWAAATTGTDASTSKLSVGYVHNLSKRTALYGTATRIRIKNGQNNPTIMGAVAGGAATYLSTGNGLSGYAPRSATGLDVGIRHAF